MESPTLGDQLWSGLQVLMAVAGALWLMFNGSEHVLKDDVRRKIGAWLARDPHVATTWPETFITLFDRVFVPSERRERGGWRPGFWRSFGASLLGVLVLFTVFYAVSGHEHEIKFNDFAFVIIFSVALNFVPDYFSLWETRWILKKLQTMKFVREAISYIIFDIFATFLVFLFSVSFWLFLFTILFGFIPLRQVRAALLEPKSQSASGTWFDPVSQHLPRSILMDQKIVLLNFHFCLIPPFLWQAISKFAHENVDHIYDGMIVMAVVWQARRKYSRT